MIEYTGNLDTELSILVEAGAGPLWSEGKQTVRLQPCIIKFKCLYIMFLFTKQTTLPRMIAL